MANRTSSNNRQQYKKIFCAIVLCCLFIPPAWAQQTPRNKELQIISDNDAYTLQGNDGYYTNGLKFIFNWTSGNADAHTIQSVEIGQLLYNAKNGSYNKLFQLDRPVAGLLYGSYFQTRFNARKDMFRLGVTVGTIGAGSYGEQVQKFIHKTLGFYTPEEWQFQLKSEWGANVFAAYSPDLGFAQNHFSIKPIIGGTLGTIATNANIGAAFLLGRIEKNNTTTFWGSALNATQGESFLFFYPQLYARAYDATVQGGFFRENKGDFVGFINHWLMLSRLGWMYSVNNFSIALSLVYESKEAVAQTKDQLYGTIQLGFKL